MASKERVHKFLSTPIRIENFYTELVGLLDQHAAEQRQACLNAAINEYYPGVLSNDVMAAIFNATGDRERESDDK